jgi:hypothetical protein
MQIEIFQMELKHRTSFPYCSIYISSIWICVIYWNIYFIYFHIISIYFIISIYIFTSYLPCVFSHPTTAQLHSCRGAKCQSVIEPTLTLCKRLPRVPVSRRAAFPSERRNGPKSKIFQSFSLANQMWQWNIPYKWRFSGKISELKDGFSIATFAYWREKYIYIFIITS